MDLCLCACLLHVAGSSGTFKRCRHISNLNVKGFGYTRPDKTYLDSRRKADDFQANHIMIAGDKAEYRLSECLYQESLVRPWKRWKGNGKERSETKLGT